MPQLHIYHGERIQFQYTGRDDETNLKEGVFKGLDYGDFEGYTEPQWFMRCWIDRNIGDRSFALAKIVSLKNITLIMEAASANLR